MSKDARPAWFCIDCEASGPVPGLYNMLSLGCCAVIEQADRRIDVGPELYLELKPVFPGFREEAMRIHGLDRGRLEREGLDPAEAMRRLADFAGAHTPAGHRPVFVGHNAPFDWMMVAYYYAYAGMPNPFGYSAVDSKALAMGLFGLPWSETSKEVLPGLLDLPAEDLTAKHRADYDARYQAELFRGLLLKHREVAAREGR